MDDPACQAQSRQRSMRSAAGRTRPSSSALHPGGLCFVDSRGPVLYGTTILGVNSLRLFGRYQ
jgi:hypothetical protein